jgi:hypothetical protein
VSCEELRSLLMLGQENIAFEDASEEYRLRKPLSLSQCPMHHPIVLNSGRKNPTAVLRMKRTYKAPLEFPLNS